MLKLAALGKTLDEFFKTLDARKTLQVVVVVIVAQKKRRREREGGVNAIE